MAGHCADRPAEYAVTAERDREGLATRRSVKAAAWNVGRAPGERPPDSPVASAGPGGQARPARTRSLFCGTSCQRPGRGDPAVRTVMALFPVARPGRAVGEYGGQPGGTVLRPGGHVRP